MQRLATVVVSFILLFAAPGNTLAAQRYVLVISEDFTQNQPSEFTLNGSATLVDGAVQLVPTDIGKAGSVFFNRTFPASTWKAEFDLAITNPNEFTPADGMAFAFIRGNSPKMVGQWGGGLGVMGLDGYAVEFDNYVNREATFPGGTEWAPGDPGAEGGGRSHVGITRTQPFEGLYATTDVPALPCNGWFHATMLFDDGRITVFLSNPSIGYPTTGVIDYYIPGFQSYQAYFGLAAGTGAGAAEYYVDNFKLYVPVKALGGK